MGLAATRTKQRFGLDPRNTAWSNDTSRFGHQFLEKFGWKPGMGLGLSPMDSQTSHIKVSIKDDNVGLGAKLKRKEKKDEFDNGECAGLDVFQRILGRLNGKESEISQELDTQRKQKIIDGKWGISFVRGEVLASTWDPKTHKLKKYSNMKKRKSEGDDSEDEDEDGKSEKTKHKKA
ncbi:Pxr1p [Saccharomyces cerevisiae x Saccharomyces kudriavzevii VIN7]|uniref:Protein PXR1 n=1 Tax=Saccharomyces cerevisiae x Saccharomyces kudriavzevii (strain VIN7) TaxID=1095631 RepID=H0GVG7_SACCK|nr:Pxr1p [Saccharomyces cerevisiae x Saccharomyces kudriavzevii VIN7]